MKATLRVRKTQKTSIFFLIMALLFFSISVQAQVLLSDDFEDGNASDWILQSGTGIDSVIDDSGSKWYNISSPTIETRMAIGDSNWTNYSLELDMKPISYLSYTSKATSGNMIYIRYNGLGSTYKILMHANAIKLQNLASGTLTISSGASNLFDTSSIYHLKVEAVGTRLKMYVDGVEKFDTKDSKFSSGKIALAAWKDTVQYDNVLVKEIVPIDLGTTKDETAPLIKGEFTTLNSGSGYCRFIPSAEYIISSDDQSFELYTPGSIEPIVVDSQAHITTGLNQTHYVYFSAAEIGDGLRIITDGSLPVELTSFSATIKNARVQLDWLTNSEINNFGFEVERLGLNNKWNKIGFVKGNGSSTSSNKYSFVDENPASGNLKYRLKQIDFNGQYEYSATTEINYNQNDISLAADFTLSKNYPNPFNPATKIQFEIPESVNGEYVTLTVYDGLGSEAAVLVNGYVSSGKHEVIFDGSNLTSGIYIFRLKCGNKVLTNTALLLK